MNINYISLLKISFISISTSSLLLSSSVNLPVKSIEKKITIYNSDLALVKESKTFNLETGLGKIIFPNVATKVITDSVIAKFINPVQLLTQDFDKNTISFYKILKQHLGKKVSFYDTVKDKSSTNSRINSGILLAINPLLIKLPSGSIVSNIIPSNIIFNSIDSDLIQYPSLIWNVNNLSSNNNTINLTYLTRGLKWSSNYTIFYDSDSKKMDFYGNLKITNNSGVSYKNIDLQCLAGDVNVIKPKFERRVFKNKALAFDSLASESINTNVTEKSFSDFHIYTVPFKVDLKNNQSKQIKFINSLNIPVSKLYSLHLSSANQKTYLTSPRNFKTSLVFFNNKKNNLNIPLPKGIVRVYQQENNETHFVGENSISNKPTDSKITIETGKAFDVTLTEKNINFSSKYSNGRYYYIKNISNYIIKNRKNKSVTVKFTVPYNSYRNSLSLDFSSNCSNNCSYKLNSDSIDFTLHLKSNDKYTLENKYFFN
jgi:hypothetical protein